MAEPSGRSRAWAIFDRIVADAAPDGDYTNPWVTTATGEVRYEPDFATLTRLLGVPLYLNAPTTSGVPALALDVWVAFELRRAGFNPDAVWPRSTAPRVLPAPVVALMDGVTKDERAALQKRLVERTPPGAAAPSAVILGKNYLKQVDVVMSGWNTGPELLISTKRMDSSFGKNAANRVEESYGDAKNLRLRHPLAALGFVYGLRSTVFSKEPAKADWLLDLLTKLGKEDDAYHAVALIVIEYGNGQPEADDEAPDQEDPLAVAGIAPSELAEEEAESVNTSEVEVALGALPAVALRHDQVPDELQPARFLDRMVRRVIDATPITLHKPARERLRSPRTT